MRTASWLPFLASNDCKVCSRAAFCSAVSVAVWSVTRPLKGGTGTCAPATTAQQSAKASRDALAVFNATPWRLSPATPYCFAGAGAKSTLGGLEISFSFSTVKLGFVLYPNTIAVRLEGKERTVTLYSCTALM